VQRGVKQHRVQPEPGRDHAVRQGDLGEQLVAEPPDGGDRAERGAVLVSPRREPLVAVRQRYRHGFWRRPGLEFRLGRY
jgi:hypothetical protein